MEDDEGEAPRSAHSENMINTNMLRLSIQENNGGQTTREGHGTLTVPPGHGTADHPMATDLALNEAIHVSSLNSASQGVPNHTPAQRGDHTPSQAITPYGNLASPNTPPSPDPSQVANPATGPELITPEELRAIFIEMGGAGFHALAQSCPTLYTVVKRLLRSGTKKEESPPAATSTPSTPHTQSMLTSAIAAAAAATGSPSGGQSGAAAIYTNGSANGSGSGSGKGMQQSSQPPRIQRKMQGSSSAQPETTKTGNDSPARPDSDSAEALASSGEPAAMVVDDAVQTPISNEITEVAPIEFVSDNVTSPTPVSATTIGNSITVGPGRRRITRSTAGLPPRVPTPPWSRNVKRAEDGANATDANDLYAIAQRYESQSLTPPTHSQSSLSIQIPRQLTTKEGKDIQKNSSGSTNRGENAAGGIYDTDADDPASQRKRKHKGKERAIEDSYQRSQCGGDADDEGSEVQAEAHAMRWAMRESRRLADGDGGSGLRHSLHEQGSDTFAHASTSGSASVPVGTGVGASNGDPDSVFMDSDQDFYPDSEFEDEEDHDDVAPMELDGDAPDGRKEKKSRAIAGLPGRGTGRGTSSSTPPSAGGTPGFTTPSGQVPSQPKNGHTGIAGFPVGSSGMANLLAASLIAGAEESTSSGGSNKIISSKVIQKGLIPGLTDAMIKTGPGGLPKLMLTPPHIAALAAAAKANAAALAATAVGARGGWLRKTASGTSGLSGSIRSAAALPTSGDNRHFEYEEFMDPGYARIFAGPTALPPTRPKRPDYYVWDAIPYAEHLNNYVKATIGWTDSQLRFPVPEAKKCPINSARTPCRFSPGSRNHYRRHLASHLPFGVGYFFCCPLCNTPTTRGDNFKRHLHKCGIWARGPRPVITEEQLKQAYVDNIWLRLPHTPLLDGDVIEQAQQRAKGKVTLPLESLTIGDDLKAEIMELKPLIKRRRKSTGTMAATTRVLPVAKKRKTGKGAVSAGGEVDGNGTD